MELGFLDRAEESGFPAQTAAYQPFLPTAK
jgi:hypothetical protein